MLPIEFRRTEHEDRIEKICLAAVLSHEIGQRFETPYGQRKEDDEEMSEKKE